MLTVWPGPRRRADRGAARRRGGEGGGAPATVVRPATPVRARARARWQAGRPPGRRGRDAVERGPAVRRDGGRFLGRSGTASGTPVRCVQGSTSGWAVPRTDVDYPLHPHQLVPECAAFMPVRPALLIPLLTLAACAADRPAAQRAPSPAPPAVAATAPAPAALVAPEGIRLPRTLPPHRAAGLVDRGPLGGRVLGTDGD